MMSKQIGSAVSDARPSPGKFWIPPGALALIILLLSSTPGTHFPKHPDYLNNAAHLIEFGLLSFLLARALHQNSSLSVTTLFLWTTFVCISFGALDEAHQFLIPERMFDIKDLLFDSLGTVLGTGSYILFKILKTETARTGAYTPGDTDG